MKLKAQQKSSTMTAPAKIHSTNYYDTFIKVAADSKVDQGTPPPSKVDKPTVAEMQFRLVSRHPYIYTSDDVFFQVFADRHALTEAEYAEARAQFFSKGQPCFRASPLTKTYGFGVHCDSKGRVALYGVESAEYQAFLANDHITKFEAMRSSKK